MIVEPAGNIHMLGLGAHGSGCAACPHKVLIDHVSAETSARIDVGGEACEVVVSGPYTNDDKVTAAPIGSSDDQARWVAGHSLIVKVQHPECRQETVHAFAPGTLSGMFGCGAQLFAIHCRPSSN
jgi:hypothetical protein